MSSESFGTRVQLLVESSLIAPSLTLAGWPCKFYRSNTEIGSDPIASFSWLALIYNLGFWLSLPLGLSIYNKIFCQQKPLSSTLSSEPETADEETSRSNSVANRKQRNLQLSDIFVATAILACAFGYWQWIRNRGAAEARLALEIIEKGGAVRQETALPWLTQSLFRYIAEAGCLRIVEVRLQNPDNALLEVVAALPYLRTLNIAGGVYDFHSLDRLKTNPLLIELAIVGRPINAVAIDVVRSLPALRRLNLMRTNISAAGVAALGAQPRLLELNLVHTDVKLSEFGRPAFAKTLRKLNLPHPAKGMGDSLRLDGWPELVHLSCYEYDELLNNEVVELTLKHLPKLESVELDTLQKFDIDFEDLPKLSKIALSLFQWDQRTSSNQIVPSFLWVGKLRMRGVPKLEKLTIFPVDTESIDIEQETLSLGLCVFNKSASRKDYDSLRLYGSADTQYGGAMGYLTHDEIELSRRQKWVDDIATQSVVHRVDFELVPLRDVKLNALVDNQSIRELVLGRSGLEESQLRELEGMEQLQVLSLVSIYVDGRMIEWLAKSFPNLRRLVCERDYVQRLRLENIPNLETVFYKVSAPTPGSSSAFMTTQSPMDALKILNAPKLSDYFETVLPLKVLHIESAPALTGLSFQSPLPAGAVIKGVRDLEFFSAGGASCSDAIVNEVLGCTGLKRLTLAHADLLPETLGRIARLHKLESLVLTGTRVNEDFAASLVKLEKLRNLRLDQCGLSNSAAVGISQLKHLQTLDCGDIALTSQDVSRLLKNLPALRQLSLAGAELDSDNIRQLTKLHSLQILDLSNCELSDDVLKVFAESSFDQLAEVKLNASKLGEVGFPHLVRRQKNMKFALVGTEIAPELMDYLISQGRVTEFDGEDSMWQMERGRRGTPSFGSWKSTVNAMSEPGDIDPQGFSPRRQELASEMESHDESMMGATEAYPPARTPLEALGERLFRWQMVSPASDSASISAGSGQ
ncbi:MAG: hypothetical protein IT422_09340 [Pirellulaceae bacterium]|nr:hypothetical protein [Pirellulaceae bacterium]